LLKLTVPIRAWVKQHLVAEPKWFYMRGDHGDGAVEVKRAHFATTVNLPMKGSKARPAILFVDDEQNVVDQLGVAGIPALHIGDLAGMADADLDELIRYSAKQAQVVHREHAADQQQAG
jgi:hypothetical protein